MLLCVLALGAAPPLPLDQERRFADALLDHDYPDLACEVLRRMAARPDLDTDGRATVVMRLGAATVAAGARRPDSDEKIANLGRAVDSLAALIRQHRAAPDLAERLFQLGVVLGERGQAARRLADERDDGAASLRADARRDFERERRLLDLTVREAAAAEQHLIQPGATPTQLKQAEDFARLRVRARLRRAWVDHHEALLHAAGSADRGTLMNAAVKRFRAFQTDHAGHTVAAYGTLGEALSLAALDRHADALAALDRAIKQTTGKQGGGDVLGLACFHKTRLLLEREQFDEAVASARAAVGRPALAGSPRGPALRLQLAEAEIGRGRALRKAGRPGSETAFAAGLREARAIAGSSPDLAPAARDVIARCLAAGAAPDDLTPAEQLAAAEHQLAIGETAAAVALLRRVVAATGQTPTAVRAGLALGRALRAQKSLDDAVAAFRRVAADHPTDPAAPTALLEVARTYALGSAVTSGDEAAGAYKQALERLVAAYPESPEAADARFFLADLLREGGDLAAAAAAFGRVPARSRYHGRARYLQGVLLWQLARARIAGKATITPADGAMIDLAETTLKRVMLHTPPFASADGNWSAAAALALADLYAHPRVGKDAAGLAVLTAFEKRFPAERDRLPLVLQRLAEHHAAQGDMTAVAPIVHRLTTEFNGLRGTPRAVVAVAAALVRARERAVQAGRIESADRIADLARSLLIWRVKRLTGVADAAKAERWAVSQLFLLGNYDTAATAARRLLTLAGADEPADGPAGVRLVLADSLIRLGKFEEARPYLEVLKTELPKSAAVRANLARCRQEAADYAGARDLWVEIKDRTPPGSRVWFESRLNLAVCYRELAMPDEARAVIRFTRELYPKLGGPDTAARFDAVEKSLEAKRP